MTSLNRGVGNSPHGYASLYIDEYWRLMEKVSYTQESEPGSYIPLVKTVTKEG
jgi:hypothetical protein